MRRMLASPWTAYPHDREAAMKLTSTDLAAMGFSECPSCRQWFRGRCGCGAPPLEAKGMKATLPARPQGAEARTPKTSLSDRMTKTEAEFNRIFLEGSGKFEAITLRMTNGHKYTPDFIVVDSLGAITAYEVKGGYRLGSYQRARLAFDQAKVEFPWITFRWHEKTKKGWMER